MNFISLAFGVFIPIFLILYFVIPNKYRYILILIGSYVFYGYGNPGLLLFLVSTTIITYLGGLLIEKKESKGILILFFLLNILILIVFKYTNFAIQNVNILLMRFGSEGLKELSLILPVGLSFYIFQSCTYLTDVYRKKISAEKNIMLYASFVSFFPTILMGPIQKSRELIPQLRAPKQYDYDRAEEGTVLFAWGLFEKILVANNLYIVVDRVYSDLETYGPMFILLAVVSFSIYIYADFSSYSDMARGIAMVMGIDVGRNFLNPYLSVTTGEFWNRWHASLNDWFKENIYIPLGGNRKGKLRKYINVMVVFLVSGLWHGSSWHFIIWGLLNGILVVFGNVLIPVKNRVYSAIGVDEDSQCLRTLKRMGVFILITLTWVLFQNGISETLYIYKQLANLRIFHFFNENIFSAAQTVPKTFATVLATLFFVFVQCKRQDEVALWSSIKAKPIIFRYFLLAVMIVVISFGIFTAIDVEMSTKFVYFNF